MSARHAAPPVTPRRAATVVRVLVAALLLASGLAVLVTPQSRASGTATAVPDSAATVTSKGEFAGLQVTVSQTRNLVNQVVSLSWKGGAPTQPAGNLYALDYLQVMQCWGDDPSGPDRDQCQFGGRAANDQRGGAFVASRQLDYGLLVDPKEPPHTGSATTYVPFRTPKGEVVTGNRNQFFDNNTTNELPYLRTREDGTGNDVFEIQTAKEAPGLGCGDTVSPTSTTIRGCWLVIVPRGTHEVDGSLRSTASTNQLDSSPLSLTNWDQRLVVPLAFAPLGRVCPLGRAERRTVGAETVVDAIGRWQPLLCRAGPVYGFSQVADAVARRQLATDDPGTAFLTGPVPASQLQAGRPLTYAPVTLSGLAIGFDINSQAPSTASEALRRQDGLRLTDLKLTARLVAKLLTQSYGQGAQSAPYLRGNPVAMTSDPEFLQLNPSFADQAISLSSLTVPAGNADVYALLWQWIGSDQDAADFVAGAKDPWGMRVNPFYQGPVLEDTTFPKADPYCTRPAGAPRPLCTLDAYPYAADLHEGTRATARGDSLARTLFDPTAVPPTFKKVPVQPTGQHALLALTDTVAAERYGLAVASLKNTAGVFVRPTRTSLLAGLGAMRPSSTPGVLEPDFTQPHAAAYPLTVLTYAVTPAAALTAAQALDAAALVRYAVGPGQVQGPDEGQLPLGYVPLPSALREQALRAATQIAARRTPARPAAPVPVTAPRAGLPRTAAVPDVLPLPGKASPLPPLPAPVVATTQAAASAPQVTQAPVVAAARTPADPLGLSRYALVIALIAGGLATGFGPLVPRWVARPER